MSDHRTLTRLFFWCLLSCLVTFGCTNDMAKHHGLHMGGGHEGGEELEPEDRLALNLDPSAQKAHQAIMREHLEAIHEIVGTLAREEFADAQIITETQLGFAKHRDAMQRQMPEDFPPAYHDLAKAHHEAAEDLAYVIPSRNFKQILHHLDRTLEACVACHRRYRL